MSYLVKAKASSDEQNVLFIRHLVNRAMEDITYMLKTP